MEQRISDRSKCNTEPTTILDVVLFVLLMLSSASLSIGRLGRIETPTAQDIPFFSGFSYRFDKPPHLLTYLLLTLINIGFYILFLYRIEKKSKARPSKWILSFFGVFVLVRFFTIFLFPYGEQHYTFFSPFADHKSFLIVYPGFSIYERIVTFTEEVGFYGFFPVFLIYFRYLRKKDVLRVLNVIYVVYTLFIFSLLAYSLATEGEKIFFNIRMLMGKEKSDLYHDVQSYMTNRNVLAWFYFLEGSLSLFFFLYHPHPFSLLMYLLMMGSCFVLPSRTPATLMTLGFILLAILYPFLFFRKHKAYSWLLPSLLLLLFLLVLLFFFLEPHDFREIFRHLSSSDTLKERKKIAIAALSMLSPLGWAFGYSKFVYTSLFLLYRPNFTFMQSVPTSHNAYFNIILEMGIFGLVLLLVLIFFALYYLLRAFFRGKKEALPFFLLVLLHLAYSYVEPNALFQRELTSFVYGFTLLLPWGLLVVREEKEDRKSLLSRVRRKLRIERD